MLHSVFVQECVFHAFAYYLFIGLILIPYVSESRTSSPLEGDRRHKVRVNDDEECRGVILWSKISSLHIQIKSSSRE